MIINEFLKKKILSLLDSGNLFIVNCNIIYIVQYYHKDKKALRSFQTSASYIPT